MANILNIKYPQCDFLIVQVWQTLNKGQIFQISNNFNDDSPLSFSYCATLTNNLQMANGQTCTQCSSINTCFRFFCKKVFDASEATRMINQKDRKITYKQVIYSLNWGLINWNWNLEDCPSQVHESGHIGQPIFLATQFLAPQVL